MIRICLLEMNNYHDVPKAEVDNKLAIAITFWKDYAIQWWINKNIQELEVVASLTLVGFKELLVEWFTLDCQK